MGSKKTKDMTLFADRHIGPDAKSQAEMLEALGTASLDELLDEVVPKTIRKDKPFPPSLPDILKSPKTEAQTLERIKELAGKNKVFASLLGQGYYGTTMPAVIRRNVLENPSWYTAYTPYQPEISQGRLELLLAFQTMVSELTGMELANASLLDEATAAAEAMTFLARVDGKIGEKGDRNGKDEKTTRLRFGVEKSTFTQTKAVLKTRAAPLGIELVEFTAGRDALADSGRGEDKNLGIPEGCYGVLFQQPTSEGQILDLEPLIAEAHKKDCLVAVAADLLALCLVEPPGNQGKEGMKGKDNKTAGADVVVGTAQRFGVPMGFGGPHAGYIAVREEYKRELPGRLVGVSKDSQGREAYRLALQTREQHIRREKATSNICTAQVLLAVISALYCAWHGPDGLKAIAENVHAKTARLAAALKSAGYKLAHQTFFDTLLIGRTIGGKTIGGKGGKGAENGWADEVIQKALRQNINLWKISDNAVSLSLDETTTEKVLTDLCRIFELDSSWVSQIDNDADAAPVSGGVPASTSSSSPSAIPEKLLRKTPPLAHPLFTRQYSEAEFTRYLKKLADKDLALDRSMIPLGSCTMKLNAAAQLEPISWTEFANIHPFAPPEQAAGYLELLNELENGLKAVTGMSAASLQPNAGSQGELAGLLAIRAYHQSQNEGGRNICLIPASAHGTNAASAVMAGMEVRILKCDAEGNVDMGDLTKQLEAHPGEVAALMITYPSTHGVFEEGIGEICDAVHKHGGQVYMDGANLNALIGLALPGDFGADVCHLNLHKTFCIPHGGGGPGVGPLVAAEHLAPFLPGHPFADLLSSPLARTPSHTPNLPVHIPSHIRGAPGELPDFPTTISAAPYGSAGILPISWAYLQMMGAEGLSRATQIAILNANYLAARLAAHYPILYTGQNGRVAHECILDLRGFQRLVSVEDVAKRLMDYGFHAPTVSFPVAGTLMVEPTESESKPELDRFIEAMASIRQEIAMVESGEWDAADNPLKNAPHTAEDVASDSWARPYSREMAAYPLPWLRSAKYWPPVSRIDSAWGDRNLFCTCPLP